MKGGGLELREHVKNIQSIFYKNVKFTMFMQFRSFEKVG